MERINISINRYMNKYQIICRSLDAARLKSGNCQPAVSLMCDCSITVHVDTFNNIIVHVDSSNTIIVLVDNFNTFNCP